MKGNLTLWGTALVLIFGTACCKVALNTPSEGESKTGVASTETDTAKSGGGSGDETEPIQRYEGKGRITHVLPDGKHVKIVHSPIGDFMTGMEMSFELRDTTHVAEGDSVHFSLTVEPDGYFYIDSLAVIH